MSKQFDDAFTSTRQICEETVSNIKLYLMKYGEIRNNDAYKKQMRYAMLILNSICGSIQNKKGVHYDIYCDIIIKILGPYIQPKLSPTLWNKYLEFLRYFHYLLIEKKQCKESLKLFDYVRNIDGVLQTEGDYKFILSIYGLQLDALKNNAQENEKEITKALESLTDLFKNMLTLNQEMNFFYPEIFNTFNQYILFRRTASLYSYISNMPLKKNEMFEAFFFLLSQQQMDLASKEKLNKYAQDILDFHLAFFQFDVVDKLQTQLALQFLKAILEQKLLQKHEGLHYMLSLLYYMTKMIYGQSMKKYPEICNKISSFLQKSGDTLIQEQWFCECLVALEVFSFDLYQRYSQNPLFEQLFKEINKPEIVLEFLRFALSATKLAPMITQTKLVSLQCCTSIRKHFMVSIATSAIVCCTFYESHYTERKEDNLLIEELNKNMILIVRNALKILNSMQCLAKDEVPLKHFFGRLIQLATNCQSSTQAGLCIKLAELLFNQVKDKLTNKDLCVLLRRLTKIAKLLPETNQNLQNDFHCCYIVYLINEPVRDLTSIKNQIALFYTNIETNVVNGLPSTNKDKCLTEIYEKCKSCFRPSLNIEGKRLLFSLEMQHILKYYKSQTPLILSLMDSKQTDYDLVMLARACKMHDKKIETLNEIKKILDMKEFHQMKRLEYLQYAHACATLLYIFTEKMRRNFRVDTKECLEMSLEETFLNEKLKDFSIVEEMRLVGIALKSLKSFQAFWEKADEEFVSSDEALIDWEAIIDDLASLAMFLELSGYFQHATDAWILFYGITRTLQDFQSNIRAVSFFCNHVVIFATYDKLNLDDIVAEASIRITNLLPSINTYAKRVQNHILLCLCQLAYYHAFKENYVTSHILLKMVQNLHASFPGRKGPVDIVFCTLLAVKFRILWLHPCEKKLKFFERKNILADIESMIERFQEITFTGSTDASTYLILVIEIVQQFVECATNRLTDNFYNSFVVAIMKLTIQSGLVLRAIQLLLIWMGSNLQMENIDKALMKLKINEHLFGVKPLHLSCKKVEGLKSEVSDVCNKKSPLFAIASVDMIACMEPIRKIAPVQLSPIKTKKLQLSPSCRNGDLKRFFVYENKNLDDPILQWNYFILGCLNTRLYFLIDDYDQLDTFYSESCNWLEKQKVSQTLLYQKMYENIKSLSIQHYVNYLRASKKHSKANKVLENFLKESKHLYKIIDSSYFYNLKLQLITNLHQNDFIINEKEKKSSSKRVLQFHFSSSDEESVKSISNVKSRIQKQSCLPPTASEEKSIKIPKALPLRIKKKCFNVLEMKPKSNLSSSNSNSSSETIYISSSSSSSSSLSSVSSSSSTSSYHDALSDIIDLDDDDQEGNHINIDDLEDENDLNTCQIIEILDLDQTEDIQLKNLKISKNKPNRKEENHLLFEEVETKLTEKEEKVTMKLKSFESSKKSNSVESLNDSLSSPANIIKKPNEWKSISKEALNKNDSSPSSSPSVSEKPKTLKRLKRCASTTTFKVNSESNSITLDKVSCKVLVSTSRKRVTKKTSATNLKQGEDIHLERDIVQNEQEVQLATMSLTCCSNLNKQKPKISRKTTKVCSSSRLTCKENPKENLTEDGNQLDRKPPTRVDTTSSSTTKAKLTNSSANSKEDLTEDDNQFDRKPSNRVKTTASSTTKAKLTNSSAKSKEDLTEDDNQLDSKPSTRVKTTASSTTKAKLTNSSANSKEDLTEDGNQLDRKPPTRVKTTASSTTKAKLTNSSAKSKEDLTDFERKPSPRVRRDVSATSSTTSTAVKSKKATTKTTSSSRLKNLIRNDSNAENIPPPQPIEPVQQPQEPKARSTASTRRRMKY